MSDISREVRIRIRIEKVKKENLTSLDLSSCNLASIPKELEGLKNLKTLYLSSNQITELKSLEGLKNLKTLDLSLNKITELKGLEPILRNIEKLNIIENYLCFNNGLVVGDNPLVHPPMNIVSKGRDAVLQYFKDLKNQGVGKLNEAKLIIVGEPNGGKSSLMEMLLDPNYKLDKNSQSTLGIDVKPWKFTHPSEKKREIVANIWDFGGQEIQYMTHQFFLTPNAVYVLMCTNKRDESNRFDYWFNIIHLLGEAKGFYSPILVVKNRKYEQHHFDFDLDIYTKQYPNLEITVKDVNLDKRDADYDALEFNIKTMIIKLPLITDDKPAK